MSKKRKKKTLAEPFSSWMINQSESESLINIAKVLKNKLDILVDKLGISSTIESIDNLYSLTIREPKKETDRNIRLVGTILIETEEGEIEKKVSLITINTKTKLDVSTLEEKVLEIEGFRCAFYAYRNLLSSIESMKCAEHMNISRFTN